MTTNRVTKADLPPMSTLDDRIAWAKTLGFGAHDDTYVVGDTVDVLSFSFSSPRVTRYDVYRIERGIVKKVNVHGTDIQTYDDLHRPSGSWLCVDSYRLRRRPREPNDDRVVGIASRSLM